MKNIYDVQHIINDSKKYNDCLLLPIGITDGKCNDLSLSCRGRMLNTNGYIICGCLDEIENFLTGLLLNACKKYTSEELKISYYYSVSNCVSIPFLRELPNIKLVKSLSDYKELETEFEGLKNSTEKRLDEIFQHHDCYARAVRGENGKLLTEIPQELLIFHVPKHVIDNSSPRSQEIHHYISQRLWRAGVYPIIVLEGSGYFPFNYYYGGRVWLPFVNDAPVELNRNQAYMNIAEDSWCVGSERKEIIDIPNYTEDWVRESISQIRENSKNG